MKEETILSVSLSLKTIVTRTLAVAAIPTDETEGYAILNVDDREALEKVAEMVISQVVLELFPHVVACEHNTDTIELKVKANHELLDAEILSLRITLESAAVFVIAEYVTADSVFEALANKAMSVARRFLSHSGFSGCRLPAYY